MDDSHDYSNEEPTHHVTGLPVYFAVFIALMVLTILTVWVSRVPIGRANTLVALTIAVTKATLVILFFMHVIHSTRLTWIVILASFLWLGVLFVLTFADYLTRSWSLY
ncbi:MAG TPA: cytochrome C oxidase subunit IV family protein [Thermoanaerobaculia bacterium]